MYPKVTSLYTLQAHRYIRFRSIVIYVAGASLYTMFAVLPHYEDTSSRRRDARSCTMLGDDAQFCAIENLIY